MASDLLTYFPGEEFPAMPEFYLTAVLGGNHGEFAQYNGSQGFSMYRCPDSRNAP